MLLLALLYCTDWILFGTAPTKLKCVGMYHIPFRIMYKRKLRLDRLHLMLRKDTMKTMTDMVGRSVVLSEANSYTLFIKIYWSSKIEITKSRSYKKFLYNNNRRNELYQAECQMSWDLCKSNDDSFCVLYRWGIVKAECVKQ